MHVGGIEEVFKVVLTPPFAYTFFLGGGIYTPELQQLSKVLGQRHV